MKIDFRSFTKHYTPPAPGQFPIGTRAYKGFQGSGKTLSMVKYCFDLASDFPKCLFFSNVMIKGLPNYKFMENDQDVADALSAQNGAEGVVVLIDEAHLYFNKKTGISLDVLTSISQQRKDRRRIILSSQIWEDLDISLRKQVKEVVNCRRFGFLQINTILKGETLHWDKFEGAYIADKDFTEVFKHNDWLYNRYDTRQKILKNDKYNRTLNSNEPMTFIVSPKKGLR